MRYFIGFLITLGLIILLIVLLVGGGGDKAKVPLSSKPLASYASTDAIVQMTIDGPVNATQDHDQIRISVDKNQMTFQHFKGYDGAVQDAKSYQNTENAYFNFLRALALQGFTLGNTSKALADYRGYCPEGQRIIFDMQQDGKSLEHFWTTSCGKPSTYQGNAPVTMELFQQQIPDYTTLTENIDL